MGKRGVFGIDRRKAASDTDDVAWRKELHQARTSESNILRSQSPAVPSSTSSSHHVCTTGFPPGTRAEPGAPAPLVSAAA
jgi:hypothetical protein